jgi:hypothetical protein
MQIVARLRRGLAARRSKAAPVLSQAPAAALRGLGEPPASPGPPAPGPAAPDAGEAELDTLRGELVRELDRLAEDDDGSGSFRRIAS